ncbi:MAG: hypothetical protein ACRDD1_01445, partial [Planctomycetia bacterium]
MPRTSADGCSLDQLPAGLTNTPKPPSIPTPRRRLLIETLEDRSVPAAPIGPEFQVNDFTTSNQLTNERRHLAMDAAGNFVVVWYGAGADDSYGVYARRYNAAGVAQGNEFRVNSATAGIQKNAVVAMDSDGDFVVAWQSNVLDGDGYGVYLKRFNAAGVAQDGEIRVNSYTTGDQVDPVLAMDADGDFVIAWTSSGQDGSGYGVYAQRFNSLAEAQGTEFHVNTSVTSSLQQATDVVMDADGDFIITWQSNQQDGSGWGVYARRYNAAGVLQGSEFQLNVYTTSSQINTSLAFDASGDFVASWMSYAQDGSIFGIYARRFESNGVPKDAQEFKVNVFTNNNQVGPATAVEAN